MTNSHSPAPNPPDPDPRSTRSLTFRLLRASIVLGGIVIVIGVAGTLAARYFIFNRLVPLVEDSLSDLINRPVEIGEVERFSLWGITLDGASIPATETEIDSATVETVRVNFNPVEVIADLIRDRELPLNIVLIDPEINAVEDEQGRWLRLQLKPPSGEEPPVRVVVEQVQARDAELNLAPYPQTGENAVDSVILENIEAIARIRNNNQLIAFDVTAEPSSGGTLASEGEVNLDTDQLNVVIRSSDVDLAALTSLVPLPLTVESGMISSNLGIQLKFDRLDSIAEAIAFNGTAQVQDVSTTLEAAPQPITNLNSRLRFQGQEIALEDTQLNYGQIPIEAGGSLNLATGYELTAEVPQVSVEALRDTLNIQTDLTTSGAFRADVRVMGPLSQPQILGTTQTVEPLQVDRVSFDDVFARFTFTAPQLQVPEIRIIPTTGGEITGQGAASLDEDGGLAFDIQANNLQGDAIARDYGANLPAEFQIGQIDAEIDLFGQFDNIQAIANWRLPTATYPGQGEIRYAGSTVRLQNTRLQAEGGTVAAEAIAQLDSGNWQATINGSGVAVNRFVSTLDGTLSADVEFAGNFNNLDLSAIQAQGQAQIANALLQLPDTPPLIDQGTWSTQFRWAGDGIQVQDFTAPGIDADGFIAVALDGAPSISNFDLNVALQNYDLTRLEAFIPDAAQERVAIAGQADFAGQLTGTLANPQVAGQLQLSNFGVNEFAYDSPLRGNVQFALQEGGNLDLSGDETERIALSLTNQYLPSAFLIRNGEILAQGQTQGNILQASIQNFPLGLLNLRPAADQGLGEVSGILNANVNVDIANLSDPTVVGAVAIARPGIGYVIADSFTGRIQYADATATLTDGDLQFGESRYLLNARAMLDPELQFQGQLTATPGRVEDILTVLQIFELDDFARALTPPIYGDAADLATLDVGKPQAPLYDVQEPDQIDYLAQILAQLQERQQQQQTAVIPPLDTLEGEFSGTVNVTGSADAGVAADFDIEGQNWAWGPYDQPNQFVVSGNYEDGTVTLEPFRFESIDSLLAFSGQVGTGTQSGQLIVENIPISFIEGFVALPIDVEGDINAIADLSGTLDNPAVEGEISLANATLNQESLDFAQVMFGYADARLEFDGAVAVEEPDLLTLSGSIPYALPFIAVQPDSDEIRVAANVSDEGLVLIDILSQGQLRWEGGSGDVDLTVQGTLDQPQILGTAIIRDAVIASQALSEPLTNTTGRIAFDLDQIRVQTLEASLGSGQVSARGTIPIFASSANATPDNPLRVTFNSVPFDLERGFSAEVGGQVIITNSALNPAIGGKINIRDGRVNPIALVSGGGDSPAETPAEPSSSPSDPENLTVTPTGGEPTFIERAEANAEALQDPDFGPAGDRIQFNNLILQLEDSLVIANSPFFNIQAQGGLAVNGTLNNIQPDGTIRLTSGWVNLFSTQFRLDRGESNTATFTPSGGLDPVLNIRMVARVSEVDRRPVPPTSPFVSSEIADPSAIESFGGVQTVTVIAQVEGPASQLSDNLELSSDPPRSDNQIIALIGGGIIGNLESGGAPLALATYFGSGFFATFSGNIADALGLSEFSIFPTTNVSDESRVPIAIGVELGFNITRNLYFNVLEILGSGTLPQFGLRYELTDELELRGSTNFSEESRVLLQYEIEF
ncbi:MAG: translocation/assembly module TamB domain-containing protein [Elainellaceae cyanobacterium]